VPESVVGYCDIDKHSSGLLRRKTILGVLWHQQGDLVYGRPPVSELCLLLRQQWVDDWFDTSIDVSLEYFEGDTEQRCWDICLWVLQWLY